MKSMMRAIMIFSVAVLVPLSSQALEPPYPSYLLVGNKGENTVSFINMDTGREVARRPVSGNAPHEISISPDGLLAAVVNYGDASIDVFGISGKSLLGSIDLGENTRPHGITWLSDNRIVATTEGNQSIIIASGKGLFSTWVVDSISTNQNGTHMVAVSPDEQIAYTANMQSGTVSRIDLQTEEVISALAGKEVEGIAVTKDGTEVWASVRGEDKVVIFDATSLKRLAEIPVGKFPLRIIVSPDGTNMVTSNLVDGSVSVIDVESRAVERTITVSGTAETRQVTLLFNEDGSRLYVAETGANKITEVDFHEGYVIGRLSGGEQGDGLAISPPSPW